MHCLGAFKEMESPSVEGLSVGSQEENGGYISEIGVLAVSVKVMSVT